MKCYSGLEASKKLKSLIANAIQALWVATAFLDNTGASLLSEAAKRGVQVRLLASDRVDEVLLENLSKSGVEVRVYEEQFLHTKIYIADGRALVGSANLTRPALEASNIEVLCEVDLREAVNQFNKLWDIAKPLIKTPPRTSTSLQLVFIITERREEYTRIIEFTVPDPEVKLTLVNPEAPGGYMIAEIGDIHFRALEPICDTMRDLSKSYSFHNKIGVIEAQDLSRCGLSEHPKCSDVLSQLRPTRLLKDEEAVEVARRLYLVWDITAAFLNGLDSENLERL
ncbi:hypothetical protein PYJP_08480 [Pyrofollis japonicus]|uniref:phospholipase D family protein n=1 Tax=Pyrofollis japonicus TaxID=3060460 RepID=UPI00295C1CE8|nr:phospholipase D family protein [Pyrofollis japonicus]BEP17496.1 hypothetical protein PYJP_08480 [Pyrofollis japonicus]